MSALVAVARRMNLRHLTRRRLRAGLTLAGIATGVALVFATTVLNTSVVESVRTLVRDLAGEADLEVAASTSAGLSDEMTQRVQNTPGVFAAAPVVRSLTNATGPTADSSLLVMGVSPTFASLLPPDAPERVNFEGSLGPDGIVLSRDAAAVVGANVGDRVLVTTPAGPRPVRVTGLIAGGPLSLLNGGLAGVMQLPAAQTLFARTGSVDAVYVVVDEGVSVADVRERVEGVVGGAATVGRPEDRVGTLTEGYLVVAALMSVTGFIALAVALLVVHNTMAMAVADRRRELAVALAIGAGRRQLLAAFVAEGAVLGLVGSLIGMGFGLLIADVLIAETSRASGQLLPISPSPALVVPPYAIGLALLGGVCVAALGAGTAARRITAVAPVEALRPAAAHEPPSTEPVRRRTTVAGMVLLVGAVLLGVIATVAKAEQLWLVNAWLIMWFAGFGLLLPWFVPKAVRLMQPFLRSIAGPAGRLAGDSLLRNPGRTAVAAASLTLTLGMVVAISGTMRSFEGDLRERVERGFAAPLHVSSQRENGEQRQPLSLDLGERLAEIEGVAYVSSERDVFLTIEGELALAIVEPRRDILLHGPAVAQTPDIRERGSTSGDEIGISRLLSRRLDLGKGDTLLLPTPTGEHRFTVSSIFQNWGPIPTVSIDREVYTERWGDHTVDLFNIYLEPGADEAAVRRQLDGFVHSQDLHAVVVTNEEMVGFVMLSFEGLLAVADGTLLVALIVAGLTIANTAFASVLERRWELGMVQALGMTRRTVARLLLIESAAVALIGTAGALVVGTVTGFGITAAVEDIYLLALAFRPPPGMLVLVVAAAFVVAAGASLLPRRVATRASLIESLRFE